MKNKKLLAIALLSLSFCFVSGVGHGEVETWLDEREVTPIDLYLLNARVNYIMRNPATFLNVSEIIYDRSGLWGGEYIVFYGLPDLGLFSKDKICLRIVDNRGRFYDKSRVVLLDDFKSSLKVIYSFIKDIAPDLNNDVVACWLSEEGIPLGYFYQGEYHLWEE